MNADTETPDDVRRLLIVEDDAALARTLGRSFERRGYQVRSVEGMDGLPETLAEYRPGYAVVDLKLKGDASGLTCVQALHDHDPDMLIVVLTGYASIATAVDAVKLGAIQYLAKPIEIEAILSAFDEDNDPDFDLPISDEPLSVDRLEWEHIQRVLNENDGNISATARALKMHRRTLQRILAKRAPR